MSQPSTRQSIFDMFPTLIRVNNSKQEVVLIAEPAPMDILCGKDKTYCQHPGNQIYSELIASISRQYATAHSKQVKMSLTKSIVVTMKTEYQSRFLRHATTTDTAMTDNNNGGWVEIPDLQARDKTSHALRFCNHHSNKNRRTTEEQEASAQHQQCRVTCTLLGSGNVSPSRMTVSSFHHSFGSSNGTFSCYDTEDSMLQRQQQTLDSFPELSTARCHNNDDDRMSVDYAMTTMLPISAPVAIDIYNDDGGHNEFDKETFDTLRSEDLHAIFSESFHENEWDDLLTLTN